LTNFAKDFSGKHDRSEELQQLLAEFRNPIQDFYTKDINLYAQDAWKATRKLTVNYGIRYEKAFLPQPPMQDANYAQTGFIHSPNNNFAPRLSLAYSLNDRPSSAPDGHVPRPLLGRRHAGTVIIGNALYQTSIS